MFLNTGIYAQDKIPIQSSDYTNQSVEMADEMRSNGKIYVVLAVVMTILGGMIGYLINIDIKTRKLENLLKKEK
ncbi:MAG: hypothetical protein OHK0038_16750 [Flammeovirgaceae bacterium]